MKIKCFKQSSTSVYEQEYDIDSYKLDLCYTRDSDVSLFYKDCLNKNVRLEMLSSDNRDAIKAIGTNRITGLYDAAFTVANSNSIFEIGQIFYPPREKLLKEFGME